MQYKREIKEWYTKNDILNIYPIGVTTYKRNEKKYKRTKNLTSL